MAAKHGAARPLRQPAATRLLRAPQRPRSCSQAIHDLQHAAPRKDFAFKAHSSCHRLTGAFLQLLSQATAATAAAPAAAATPGGLSRAAAPTEGTEQSLQLLLEWQHLLHHTQQLAHELLPQQASLIAYALAKLQRPATTMLVHSLFQQLQAEQQLTELPAVALTNALWAAAVLSSTSRSATAGGNSRSSVSYSPSHAWCDSVYAVTGGRLPEFNHHQLTSLLWSVGRLQQRPPAGWVLGLLQALRPALPRLSTTQLTNTIWALAQIGYRPSKAWMRAWFRAAARVFPSCSPDHLACMAGSLALLRVDPPYSAWIVQYRARVQQLQPQLRPRHVATILCGLGKRRSSQPPFWVTQLLRQLLVRQLHACTARELAAAVWALPLLLAPTAVDWTAQPANAALLHVAAAASLPMLPSCSLGELVQLATGFARLRYFPGVHWLKTHENAVAALHLQLSDANKARLRLALSKLWQDT